METYSRVETLADRNRIVERSARESTGAHLECVPGIPVPYDQSASPSGGESIDPCFPYMVRIIAGSRCPAVCGLDLRSGTVIHTTPLYEWGTSYAMDSSDCGRLWAYGTRKGIVGVERGRPHDVAPEETAADRCLLHDPILSLSFVDKTEFVVSTKSGRLAFFDIHSDGLKLRDVIPVHRQLSSLCNLGEGRLAGLTPEGDLLFYEPPFLVPTHASTGPAPEPPCTQTRLLYWRSARVLVHLARLGSLVFHDMAEGVACVVSAHTGSAYAAVLHDNSLLTFGAQDRCCHVWNPGDRRPARSYTIPLGIVSAAVLVDAGIKLVLIDKRGQAGVYRAQGKRIKKAADVPGQDYRIAVSPPPEALSAAQACWKARETQRLANELEDALLRGCGEEIARLHTELAALGSESVSLDLQAARAEDEGQQIKALRLRMRFTSAVPDTAEHVPGLAAAAETLERTFRLETAANVWRRVSRIASNSAYADRLEKIERRLAAMAQGSYVWEDAGPCLHLLIDAAEALTEPFTGRIVLKSLRAEERLHPSVTLAQLVEKCCARAQSRNLARCVRVAGEDARWIRPSGVASVPTVAFRHGDGLEGLEFVVRLDVQESSIFLTPHVVWAAPTLPAGTNVGVHNCRVRERLRAFQDQPELANLWMEGVEQVIREAVSRLNNERYEHPD